VEGYSSEGMGIARIDGQVVFIHGAVRGEVCTVRILKVLKQVAFARVEQVLERGKGRQEPDCPHYPACGGCDFRHVTYEEIYVKAMEFAGMTRDGAFTSAIADKFAELSANAHNAAATAGN